MAAPQPGFTVSALAPLAKTMPREEYMRLVMNAFQDAKRKQMEESSAAAKKKTRAEPASIPGEYGEELRSMIHTFGAARTVDVDVLVRLEDLAKAFITQLCAKLVKEINGEPEKGEKKAGQKAAPAASQGKKPAAKGRRKKQTDDDGYSGEQGAGDAMTKIEKAASGDEITEAEDAPNVAEQATHLKPLKMEHIAAVLNSVPEVQRLADIVVALRRSRHEKMRQSLDNEADAEGDLFPRALLEAAAGAVGENSNSAAPPAAISGALTEPFWAKYDASERNSSARKLARLQRRDQLTRALGAAEYLQWSECAKASFTKPRRRKKFATWAALDASHAPFTASKEVIDVLGQLTYEHVEGIVTAAMTQKGTPFPVLTLSDLPVVPSQ